jgi:hypothetical protein
MATRVKVQYTNSMPACVSVSFTMILTIHTSTMKLAFIAFYETDRRTQLIIRHTRVDWSETTELSYCGLHWRLGSTFRRWSNQKRKRQQTVRGSKTSGLSTFNWHRFEHFKSSMFTLTYVRFFRNLYKIIYDKWINAMGLYWDLSCLGRHCSTNSVVMTVARAKNSLRITKVSKLQRNL